MKQITTLFLTLLLFGFASNAQSVTGTVKDAEGLPLPGVNIKVVSTNAATISDMDGNFSINANPGEAIEFSFIGYATKVVNASPQMNVALAEEARTLTEVVVVGYGTQKAGAVTGSISQVKASEIIKTPAQSAVQAIQGKAAGVNIVTNDEPGANPTIRVRGLGTVIGSRDPLYIVDGVEASGLNGLSPNEIASMDILKDASSLAIYGQRGANGVVIVTTKKGKEGKAKVTYDTFYGLKYIQRKVDMADSQRFAYYNNYAMGQAGYFSEAQPYSTNWLDEITQTGEVMSHNVSISGGSESVNYYFGATNYEEKGILKGADFRRTNLSSRNEYKLFNNALKISQNMNVALSHNKPMPLSAFTNAYKQSPIVPVRFDNGRYGVPLRNTTTGLIDINGSDRFNNVGNPVAQLENTHTENKNVMLFGSVAAELKLFRNLKFTSNFGTSYETYQGYNYVSALDNYLAANPTMTDADFLLANPDPIYNTLEVWKGSNFRWNWDNYLTFNDTFGKHGVTVTAGMTRSRNNINDYLKGTRRNVPANSNYWNLDFATYNNGENSLPSNVTQGWQSTPTAIVAYFARAEYDYDGKYLLNAIIRREGSSAFQSGNQFENFPSISAGWVISNESFMKDSKIINFLKLRGGYGEVGNGNAGNAVNVLTFRSGYNYSFGGVANPGTNIPFAIDPTLSFETMSEVDFGLDFRLLDNRLSGTFDVYDRRNKNLIVQVTPPYVVSQENVTVNAGEVSNKGLEATLRWDDRIGQDFRYWVGGNFSYNKNNLESVNNLYFSQMIGGSTGNGWTTKQVLVGQPLGSFYVYDVTGYDSSGQHLLSPERVVAGSYIPKYTYGFQIGFEYKGFDFSADVYGVGGNKLYNGKKAQRFGGENVEADYFDSFWTFSTPNAENPSPSLDVPEASTYFVEDGAYLRVNNITLGYTFPEFTDKITKARLFVTAVNPFLFTKFSGFSPEIVGNDNGNPLGTAGIELDAYPTNKTFSVGLNLSF